MPELHWAFGYPFALGLMVVLCSLLFIASTSGCCDSAAVLLLFVGSGAAALIFEIVWLQSLQLVIGSSTISLACSLERSWGMCLGSFLAPRVISPDAIRCASSGARDRHRSGRLLLLFAMPFIGGCTSPWGGNGLLVSSCERLWPASAFCADDGHGATLPGGALDGCHANRRIVAGIVLCRKHRRRRLRIARRGVVLLRVYDITIATLVAASLNVLWPPARWLSRAFMCRAQSAVRAR